MLLARGRRQGEPRRGLVLRVAVAPGEQNRGAGSRSGTGSRSKTTPRIVADPSSGGSGARCPAIHATPARHAPRPRNGGHARRRRRRLVLPCPGRPRHDRRLLGAVVQALHVAAPAVPPASERPCDGRAPLRAGRGRREPWRCVAVRHHQRPVGERVRPRGARGRSSGRSARPASPRAVGAQRRGVADATSGRGVS